MSVTEDRKFSRADVCKLLESAKGRTLGEIDSSSDTPQFLRTLKSNKITGIAGDVIEQSLFKYARDSKQECDIEIDGQLTELKTTGVRVLKSDMHMAHGKLGDEYNAYLSAKEGISITAVTFEPTIQKDFHTSHFWQKAERLLIVFYEYTSYDAVPASEYANFPIVGYCFNMFSENEQKQLQSDWEIVRDYLTPIYEEYATQNDRNERLQGFTHVIRPNLLLIELVPGFKKRSNGSYQRPRYRLKQTFVNYIVKGHFNKSRLSSGIQLKESFSSFSELDLKCHNFRMRYGGMTFAQLKDELKIDSDVAIKNFGALCVLRMFDVNCTKLNQISDFTKAGIIAKTVTLTPKGGRTEDMKLQRVDFEEWADRDIDFEDSAIYSFFCEHSFLCPIFCQKGDIPETIFMGFKRFHFDDDFIMGQVKRTWDDSRATIHQGKLKWEASLDSKGNQKINKSGSAVGAPNLPKSNNDEVFFRGAANNSSDSARTECVNGVYMLPQFFWIKGSYIVNKLSDISFL